MFYTDFQPRYGDKRGLAGYDMDIDEEAVKNSLRNIFLVQQTECPGKPDFGNPLRTALFDNFTFASERKMEDVIQDVVRKYEPRIKIEGIKVTKAEEYNRLIVDLKYSYVLNDDMQYGSLLIPYSHNSISYLGGRIRPPQAPEKVAKCHFEK